MKRVTLTFDNGPTEKTTPFVLAELAERDLLAYFCVVGTQLQSERQVEITRHAFTLGHKIVNHSLTHLVPLGDEPTMQHARAEIADMHALMREKLGFWGEHWFRPFGRGGAIGPHIFSTSALSLFEEFHYSVLLWNSVPRDWEDPKGWVEICLKEIDQHEHTVVVLHDLDTGAMEPLPYFLDELLKLEIEITQELPDECIPIRAGKPSFAQAQLAALVCSETLN